MFTEFLAKNGEIDDVLPLISFSVKELPKEQYIIEALKSALSVIISQTKKTEDNWLPSTRNRDFEHKQVELAQALEMQLERNS